MYPMWNNYGMQTPYSNPYGQTMQQALQPCSITKVSGENGAKAFGMAPNSSALLLDETAPLVWLKTTDGAGYPTLTPYTITPYQAAPPVAENGIYTLHAETTVYVPVCCNGTPTISAVMSGVAGTVTHVCASVVKLA